MNPRSFALAAAIATLLAIAALAVVLVQQRRIKTLTAVLDALAQEHAARIAAESVPTPEPPSTPAPPPLSLDEKVELLSLRSRVTDLRERQRQIPIASNENAQLRAKLIGIRSYASGRPPPDYIRRADARFLGTATPSATLQSLLWAVERRDIETLLKLFTPEEAAKHEARFQQVGAEEFFKPSTSIPGFRDVRQEWPDAGEIEFQLELAPGFQTPVRLVKTNGAWLIRHF